MYDHVTFILAEPSLITTKQSMDAVEQKRTDAISGYGPMKKPRPKTG